jgi:hypothetical protein
MYIYKEKTIYISIAIDMGFLFFHIPLIPVHLCVLLAAILLFLFLPAYEWLDIMPSLLVR